MRIVELMRRENPQPILAIMDNVPTRRGNSQIRQCEHSYSKASFVPPLLVSLAPSAPSDACSYDLEDQCLSKLTFVA